MNNSVNPLNKRLINAIIRDIMYLFSQGYDRKHITSILCNRYANNCNGDVVLDRIVDAIYRLAYHVHSNGVTYTPDRPEPDFR